MTGDGHLWVTDVLPHREWEQRDRADALRGRLAQLGSDYADGHGLRLDGVPDERVDAFDNSEGVVTLTLTYRIALHEAGHWPAT
jgi:hypothetical protein